MKDRSKREMLRFVVRVLVIWSIQVVALAVMAWLLSGALLLSTLGLIPLYWVVGLGLGLLAVGYGLANPPRVDALMSTAPNEIAGAASSSNSVGVESGSAAGMALSTTLAMAFAGRAFFNPGTQAGLSSAQVQQAVEVLRKVINDGLTIYPGISQSALDQLIEGARTAFSMGIAQTMLVLAGVLLISCVITWFGMRSYQPGAANQWNLAVTYKLVARLPSL